MIDSNRDCISRLALRRIVKIVNLTRCYVILSSKQFPLQFSTRAIPSWIIARKRINVIHAPLNSVWNDATSSYLLFLNAFRSLQYRFLSSWSKLNVDPVAIYISNNRRRCYVSLRRVKIKVQNLRVRHANNFQNSIFSKKEKRDFKIVFHFMEQSFVDYLTFNWKSRVVHLLDRFSSVFLIFVSFPLSPWPFIHKYLLLFLCPKFISSNEPSGARLDYFFIYVADTQYSSNKNFSFIIWFRIGQENGGESKSIEFARSSQRTLIFDENKKKRNLERFIFNRRDF